MIREWYSPGKFYSIPQLSSSSTFPSVSPLRHDPVLLYKLCWENIFWESRLHLIVHKSTECREIILNYFNVYYFYDSNLDVNLRILLIMMKVLVDSRTFCSDYSIKYQREKLRFLLWVDVQEIDNILAR